MPDLLDLSNKGMYNEILNLPIIGDEVSQYITHYYRYLSAYYTNNKEVVLESINNMNRLLRSCHDVNYYYQYNRHSIEKNLVFAKKYIGTTHAVLIPCMKEHICILHRLLTSIEDQTKYPDEIIIFVSSSTMDDVKNLRLPKNTSIYVTERPYNASDARNRLYHLSNSDIISFFDADDIMHHQRCEFMVRAIENGYNICKARLSKFPLPHEDLEFNCINAESYYNERYHHGCPTLRREVMDNIKYDVGKYAGEDTDFLYRCGHQKMGLIPLVLTHYVQTNRQSIIGRLIGGLGNQLFIIAKTLYFSHKYGMPAKFYLDNHQRSQGHPTSKYKKIMSNVLNNQFDINQKHVTVNEKQIQYYDVEHEIQEAYYHAHNVILHGYWQSESHFPNFKRQLMEYLNIKIDNERPDDDCLIMVRRGDYLKFANIHNPCYLDYYKKAMELMGNKNYYITSDDIEYCKKEFPNCEIIDGDDEDVFIECCKFKNFIISNSSYHWFVSYFADSNKIIAPSDWLLNEKVTSIYRDDMIVLDR